MALGQLVALSGMNAYVVKTKEMRSYTEPVLDYGVGPQIPVQPIAPVVAATAAQAKRLFLDEFSHRSDSGVYTDDWTSLRVRLLFRDINVIGRLVDLRPGVHEENDELWGRIHEVEDHDGLPCDCPEIEDAEPC